jgi:catechol 2,3-dioxygenase-like lactoylglutathione lyase family enzyme
MNISANSLIPELGVSDFSTSLGFYTRILGFTVAYQRPEDGFAFLVLGMAQLMIDEIGKGRTWETAALEFPLGRGLNFQIAVQSVQPIVEAVTRQHIPLFVDLEEKWYRRDDCEVGQKQFAIQDPDGYLLRFVEDLGTRPLK